MLGEMRDMESTEMAIRVALTGHLIFTTLHTSDTIGAIFRLLDMGIPAYMITSAVTGVLAQRLIRKVCLFCASKQDKAGCPYCKGTGYYGRIGVFELLVMRPELSEMIIRRASMDEIRKEAAKHGWVSLRQQMEAKLMRGETAQTVTEEWLDG
jgi:type II secretory ATPase GspE/PulE/Tfp pilus assembly ATPase PilB-like protein